jgi:hypothetical protein
VSDSPSISNKTNHLLSAPFPGIRFVVTHTHTHTQAHARTHADTQPHLPPVQRAGGCSHWEACRIKCRPLNPHAFEQCQKQRKQLQDP